MVVEFCLLSRREESSSGRYGTKGFLGRETLTFDWFGGGRRTGHSLKINQQLLASIKNDISLIENTAMHELFSFYSSSYKYLYLPKLLTSHPPPPRGFPLVNPLPSPHIFEKKKKLKKKIKQKHIIQKAPVLEKKNDQEKWMK